MKKANKKLITHHSLPITKKGFTLIELLAVIFIIGVLATAIIVYLNSAREKSRDSRRMADLDTIRTALEMFYDDNGYYPSTKEDCPSGGHWLGGDRPCLQGANFKKYLDPIPRDPLYGKIMSGIPSTREFHYIYWNIKLISPGDPSYTREQSYTLLAGTENPHPDEGYKWHWAGGVPPEYEGAYGDYYYAIAGS